MFTAHPREIWRQIWSSNPQERLNKEILRNDVAGIFPSRYAIIQLVGPVPAEQHDERIETHLYLGLEILAETDHTHRTVDTPEITVTPDTLTACQPGSRGVTLRTPPLRM